MDYRPLISIGIPTYNRADSYLRQALDSALSQTYSNCEIIVSDNCSTDHTPDLVATRAGDRLRYFRHDENIGANNNFNYCLQVARGEYFLMLHDDDLIDPDFVESCVEALQGSGEVGIVRTGTRLIDGTGRVRSAKENTSEGLSAADLFLQWFSRDTAFYLCSTLFNTSKLKEHGGFDSPEGLYQDVVALADLAVRYGRVDVAEVKASFRRHDENKGSSSSALAWAHDSLYLLDLLTELMPERSAELRQAGLPYFCRKCYRIARSIPSARERWQAYLTIYRRFERTYSPVWYSLESARKDARAALGRFIRGQRPASTSGSMGGGA